MPAYRHCTIPGCSPADSQVVLRSEAAYQVEERTERFAYAFRRCARCRMGFVDPVPSEAVLSRLYTAEYPYYAPAGDHPERETRSWKYRVAAARYQSLTAPVAPTAGSRAAALLGRLAELLAGRTITLTLGIPLALPAGARILDFGYGTGSWLIAMRLCGYSRLAGYDIEANVERSADLRARGIQVIPPGGLPAVAAASFDCVRLEHVFEHLPDPPATLRQLHRLLAPGGRLVMTFPAIYPWLEIADLSASPFLGHLELPIHLALHSLESATRLVRSAGFAVAVARITRRERFITLLAQKPAAADDADPRN